MRSRFKYHITVVVFCLIIFIESSFPSDAYPKLEFDLSDKLIHFCLYFFLFFAFYYSFNNQIKFKILTRYTLFMALIFTSVYGASDEFHQFFVPGRTCEFYDWVADFLGSVFALIILLLYKKYFIAKKNNTIKPVL